MNENPINMGRKIECLLLAESGRLLLTQSRRSLEMRRIALKRSEVDSGRIKKSHF